MRSCGDVWRSTPHTHTHISDDDNFVSLTCLAFAHSPHSICGGVVFVLICTTHSCQFSCAKNYVPTLSIYIEYGSVSWQLLCVSKEHVSRGEVGALNSAEMSHNKCSMRVESMVLSNFDHIFYLYIQNKFEIPSFQVCIVRLTKQSRIFIFNWISKLTALPHNPYHFIATIQFRPKTPYIYSQRVSLACIIHIYTDNSLCSSAKPLALYSRDKLRNFKTPKNNSHSLFTATICVWLGLYLDFPTNAAFAVNDYAKSILYIFTFAH